MGIAHLRNDPALSVSDGQCASVQALRNAIASELNQGGEVHVVRGGSMNKMIEWYTLPKKKPMNG
jgi:hypothetical protein